MIIVSYVIPAMRPWGEISSGGGFLPLGLGVTIATSWHPPTARATSR